MSTDDRTRRWRDRISRELWESVVPFWMEHSLDHEFGGFLNCLDRDGEPFDTTKHVWLQGRQVWMLSQLHVATGEVRFLEAARLGAEFLKRHARDSRGRAYFALDRRGRPVSMQRKIFSECFLVMAFAEFARASGDDSYRALALELFDLVLSLVARPEALGRPALEGAPPARDLAVPMILLNVVSELRGAPGGPTFDDRHDFDAIERSCAANMLLHFDRETDLVLESVAPDGARIDSPQGRLLNPGHAIEAAWFLATYADRVDDERLQAEALDMMRGALEVGWDDRNGGLFYFLDAEGYSPTQLEWSMKLWWPHCEAMVGTLVAWRLSGDDDWFERFDRVAAWAFEHFPDSEFGEWYGYLDRQGRVSQRFKGGPYKGFFHVPRALWLCERMLREP